MGGWAGAALRGIPRVYDTTVRVLAPRRECEGRSPPQEDALAVTRTLPAVEGTVGSGRLEAVGPELAKAFVLA